MQYLWNDVELASYSTHKLFKDEITSFGKLYKMARLNNKELYNRLYGTNIDVIEEVFLSNPKPPFTSELY